MADSTRFENLIWQIADLLRGSYRRSHYGRVLLPMTVLRRFDCVLESTKEDVEAEYRRLKDDPRYEGEALDAKLNRIAGERYHNHSPFDFQSVTSDPRCVATNLVAYVNGFSANVRRIFECFELKREIERMDEANVLYLVVSQFADLDLRPAAVPNEQMGSIFQSLVRGVDELANGTAGEHSTPRDVLRLMVRLLFAGDQEVLASEGIVRRLLDPACGVGGGLYEAQNYVHDRHPQAQLVAFGQDINQWAFATSTSAMLIERTNDQGAADDQVRLGNCLTDDQFEGDRFDYLMAVPPFGVDWKHVQYEIRDSHDRDPDSPFRAGLPRINDSSFLFLQHMLHKLEVVDPEQMKYGGRLAVVFSGSPLFAGGAESGDSNIRRWIITNDWLEAIVALPEHLFYNTGIGTYIWLLTNRKEPRRRGKVQLIDARDLYVKLRRNPGQKSRKIGEPLDDDDQIGDAVGIYEAFANGERSRLFDNDDFGFTHVTIDRPLRLRYQLTVERKARFLDVLPQLLDDIEVIDNAIGRDPIPHWNYVWGRVQEILRKRRSRWRKQDRKLFRDVFTERDADALPVLAEDGQFENEPDPELRDFENVPLKDDVDEYFEREVQPYVPDASMDRGRDKVGYEINFNRYFVKRTPQRPLEEIDADLKKAEEKIVRLLQAVTE